MERQSLLAGIRTLGVALGVLVGMSSLADAADISGRLVNKTPKGKGVEGIEVTLTAYRNEQEAGKSTTSTDRNGRFQFGNLSTKPGETYTVTVRYQGAEYNSERLVLSNAEATRNLEIPVYDATTDPSQISVKVHHVLFSLADGGLQADELIVVRNAGDRAYAGSKEVAGGRRATLQFSLPAGAREVKYGEGLMECCIVPGEQGFVDTMDVKPGDRQVVFSYALPPAGGRLPFIRRVDYPTEAVEVFVPEGALQVSSQGLKSAGVVPGQDRRFQRYTGGSLAVPAAIELTFENLPAIGGGWRPYAYASVGILLLAGSAYPVVRRRRAVPSAAIKVEAPQPSSRVRPPAQAVAPGPLTQTGLAIRKVELVAALAELEAGREAGRIPEKDYRRLRQEKRKALRDVLAQLTPSPNPSPPGTPPLAGCGRGTQGVPGEGE